MLNFFNICDNNDDDDAHTLEGKQWTNVTREYDETKINVQNSDKIHSTVKGISL